MDISLDISDLRVAMSRYDRLYGEDEASFRVYEQRDFRGHNHMVYPDDQDLGEESDSEDEDEDEDEVLHLHDHDMENDVSSFNTVLVIFFLLTSVTICREKMTWEMLKAMRMMTKTKMTMMMKTMKAKMMKKV